MVVNINAPAPSGPRAKNVYFASPHLAHHSKAKSLAFSFCPLDALP